MANWSQRTKLNLTESEVSFLKYLRTEGAQLCKNTPPSDSILSLVGRGYCVLREARVGPLGARAGDVMVELSEAGRYIIGSLCGDEEADLSADPT